MPRLILPTIKSTNRKVDMEYYCRHRCGNRCVSLCIDNSCQFCCRNTKCTLHNRPEPWHSRLIKYLNKLVTGSSSDTSKSEQITTPVDNSTNEKGSQEEDKEKDKIENNSDLCCKICYSNQMYYVFGCGHSLCASCTDALLLSYECPFCRTKIETKIKIHFL